MASASLEVGGKQSNMPKPAPGWALRTTAPPVLVGHCLRLSGPGRLLEAVTLNGDLNDRWSQSGDQEKLRDPSSHAKARSHAGAPLAWIPSLLRVSWHL